MGLISKTTELEGFLQTAIAFSLSSEAASYQPGSAGFAFSLANTAAPQSVGILAGYAPLSHYSLRPSFISTPAVITLIFLLIIDTRNAQS